jgi:DNA-binding PadR family transcriptional regulator
VPARPNPQKYLPLKPLSYSVLLALAEQDDYGYDIAKRIAEPGGGAIVLAPSNMYDALDRLRSKGLIDEAERTDSHDERRTYFRLTTLGQAVLGAETQRLRTLLGSVLTIYLAEDRG